jgi:hypothetical protein
MKKGHLLLVDDLLLDVGKIRVPDASSKLVF